MIALLLVLQAAAAPAGEAANSAEFDLNKAPPPSASEIIVTGVRHDWRTRELPDKPQETIVPQAEFRLFGKAKIAAQGIKDSQGTGGIGLTFKLPF